MLPNQNSKLEQRLCFRRWLLRMRRRFFIQYCRWQVLQGADEVTIFILYLKSLYAGQNVEYSVIMNNFYSDVQRTVQQTTDVAHFGQEEGGVFYVFGCLPNNNDKNDRRNSGGTLRQKFNLNDI